MTSKKALSPVCFMMIAIILFMLSFGAVEFVLRDKIEQHHYYVKEQVQLLIEFVALAEGRGDFSVHHVE